MPAVVGGISSVVTFVHNSNSASSKASSLTTNKSLTCANRRWGPGVNSSEREREINLVKTTWWYCRGSGWGWGAPRREGSERVFMPDQVHVGDVCDRFVKPVGHMLATIVTNHSSVSGGCKHLLFDPYPPATPTVYKLRCDIWSSTPGRT